MTTEDKPKFPSENPLTQSPDFLKPIGPALKNYLKETASIVNPSAFDGGGNVATYVLAEEVRTLRDGSVVDKAALLGSTATTDANAKTWNFTSIETGKSLGPAPVSSYAKVMVDAAKRRHAAEGRKATALKSDPVTFAKGDAIKKEFATWLLGELRLEKVHHSVAHKILPTDLPVEAHVLIVNHDWARLLKDADTSGPASRGGGVRLPYPITAFEFFFHGGVHAVAIAMQRGSSPEEDPHDIQTSTHFKIKSGWLKAKIEIEYDEFGKLVNPDQLNSDNPLMKVYDLITANIFAISAMLEAEVATATPVCEAYKRNRERPVRKELPGLSHHVVSLARRARTTRSDSRRRRVASSPLIPGIRRSRRMASG